MFMLKVVLKLAPRTSFEGWLSYPYKPSLLILYSVWPLGSSVEGGGKGDA